MHWVEWDRHAMGSGAFLPATTASPNFIGNYDVSKPFPNPLKSNGAWASSPIVPIMEANGDPSVNIPGDVGDIVYYPYQEGPFQTSQTSTMSFAILENSY